jgi:hypothetical protein
MDIDHPLDFGINEIINFHNFCHYPDHLIEICIVKIEDESRTPSRLRSRNWRGSRCR